MMSVMACMVVLVISILEECKVNVRNSVYSLPLPIRWIIYLFAIGLIIIANDGAAGMGGFMYANF